MATIHRLEPYIQPLNKDWYKTKVAALDILRLDVVHPKVSGNKWFKLKYNLEYCFQEGIKRVLTFGGAFSNHLLATAYAAAEYHIQVIAIVRGEELSEGSSPTLAECHELGVTLVFTSRSDYKKRNEKDYQESLAKRYDAFVIPEGGANEFGRKGAEEICSYFNNTYNKVLVSVGTGTTFAGIRNALSDSVFVEGFAPMKNGTYLTEEVRPFINKEEYTIYDEWHFGGFGKHTAELVQFMNDFYTANEVPLDHVYTAKMMYGIQQRLLEDKYSDTDRLLCIHTGGLQGNNSISDQLVFW